MALRLYPVLALALLFLLSCAGAKSQSALPQAEAPMLGPGRALFLKNCAHCHGADAHGGEGPDLHNIAWTGEEISARILQGKKGQMTAFEGKLRANEIEALVGYVRSLK